MAYDFGLAARRAVIAAAAAAAALLPPAAPAQDVVLDELGQMQDRDWEARCLITSRIFYRLGDLRTGGADRVAATFKVRQWIGQLGDSGSHMHYDYGKSVEAGAAFVYRHPELNRLTLAHYGYRSCGFQYLFPGEPSRVQAGQMLLLDAAAACQQQHPGDRNNPALRDCIKERFEGIAARVRKAKIAVEG